MANNKRSLKAYVRFDGTGRVVSGSLILRKQKPRVGKWMEVPAYECCNPTTTSTTTIPAPTYNFDLTSPNWASEGVTDEASFINWLTGKSLRNIVVTDFNFVGDRIFCNMTADGNVYNLIGFGLVNADKIGIVNGLTILILGSNQIVKFNPTTPLPITLTTLSLVVNQMTLAGYTASEVWANAQPAFTNPCIVQFGGNIDSITGTNLEAILLTKNCVISV